MPTRCAFEGLSSDVRGQGYVRRAHPALIALPLVGVGWGHRVVSIRPPMSTGKKKGAEAHKKDTQETLDLFGDPQRSITDQVLRAYEHRDRWMNRMILGDSLVVMNSLVEYEG